jgi:hypothetical protein
MILTIAQPLNPPLTIKTNQMNENNRTAQEILKQYKLPLTDMGESFVYYTQALLAMEEYASQFQQPVKDDWVSVVIVAKALNCIAEMSQPGIPYYAYGDNEAACSMAQIINEIGDIARSAIASITPPTTA